MGSDDHTRVRTPKVDDPTTLAHESLKQATEKARIAWGRSDDKPQTVRAKRKLRDQAREFSGLALATLVDTCLTGDTSSARVSAAKELLDRGYGKSTEHLEIDDKRDSEAAAMVAQIEHLQRNPDTAAALLVLAEANAKTARTPRD